MVPRQFPKEDHASPAPPAAASRSEWCALCSVCDRGARWPSVDLWVATGRTCAPCLGRDPVRTLAVVLGEAGAGPYRSAPVRVPAPPRRRWLIRGWPQTLALIVPIVVGAVARAVVAWGAPETRAYFALTVPCVVVWALIFVRRGPPPDPPLTRTSPGP